MPTSRRSLFLRDYFSTSQMIVKPFWKAASWWGLRNLGSVLQRTTGAYSDTILHFDTSEKLVALTIDDGIVRSSDGNEHSMLKDVLDLLETYQAHATFFVCTEYTSTNDTEESIQTLLEQGHEIGNHLERDVPFYYSRLNAEAFEKVLLETNSVLDQLDGKRTIDNKNITTSTYADSSDISQRAPTRWFRAPSGYYDV